MKYLAPLIALLLLLLPQPARGGYGYAVIGDETFTAKVYDADNVVKYGGDKWRDYVYDRLSVVVQWSGDADDHFGIVRVQDGYGAFYVRRDGYDALWLAMALVHEAAHVEQARQGKPLDGCAEIEADRVTARFARAVGLEWRVRTSEEVWGGCENGDVSNSTN